MYSVFINKCQIFRLINTLEAGEKTEAEVSDHQTQCLIINNHHHQRLFYGFRHSRKPIFGTQVLYRSTNHTHKCKCQPFDDQSPPPILVSKTKFSIALCENLLNGKFAFRSALFLGSSSLLRLSSLLRSASFLGLSSFLVWSLFFGPSSSFF